MRYLRIHGDNIIECERALNLIALAFNCTIERNLNKIYFPIINLKFKNHILFRIELLSGHGRYGNEIASILRNIGASLREATDAYITEVDGQNETILLAIEFCNALPAGNNAWQRNGRALTCAELGIPYLYYAEIGGVELGRFRKVKAPRFPNPIVPFSYLTASFNYNIACLPIYGSHPGITPMLKSKFQMVFGIEESIILIKEIIDKNATSISISKIVKKGTNLVKILSNERKRIDTLKGDKWDEFLLLKSGKDKAEWLKDKINVQPWNRKQSDKVVVTRTFKSLLNKLNQINLFSIGAKEIPICLLDSNNIGNLIEILESTYNNTDIVSLTDYLLQINEAIVIVWITGFKPRGDDSRPDRGLLPLARMLFGNEIKIFTFVFGPSKQITWEIFRNEPLKLPITNGLWESIFNLSDIIFSDSSTSKYGPLYYITDRNKKNYQNIIKFDIFQSEPTDFSEHDVDTAIHSIFSNQIIFKIYESMCNPPGGDWSGISLIDFNTSEEYRWTSLPRVSAINGKRPDHLIQIFRDNLNIFLSVESKNNFIDLENDIGERLTRYVDELFINPPIAYRKNKEWLLNQSGIKPNINHKIFSVGAFCYNKSSNMLLKDEKKLDILFGFEFDKLNNKTTLHLSVSKNCNFIIRILNNIINSSAINLKIKIYRF